MLVCCLLLLLLLLLTSLLLVDGLQPSKIPRLYVPSATTSSTTSITIPPSRENYVSRVLRLGPNKKKRSILRVFNENVGELLCEFTSPTTLITKEILRPPPLPPKQRVNLIFVPIKPTRQRLILEKSTELNVDEFTLLRSDNCQQPIDGPDDVLRWERIIHEATEQSERLTPPLYRAEGGNLNALCDKVADGDLLLFCRERSEST